MENAYTSDYKIIAQLEKLNEHIETIRSAVMTIAWFIIAPVIISTIYFLFSWLVMK